MSRSVELHQTAKVGEIGIASAGIPNAAAFFTSGAVLAGHRSSSSRCAPAGVRNVVQHLQIPVYLISTQESGRKSQWRLTGPKLRRWCSVAPCSASFPDEKRLDTLCVGQNHIAGKNIQRRHFGVTRHFRQDRRGTISGTRLSPFTTAIEGIGNFGSGYHQSTHIPA